MFKQRTILTEILLHLEKKEFTIITGARQVGKTTILQEIYKKLENDKKDVWYINFEKQDILRSINQDPENLFQYTNRPVNPLYSKNKTETRIYILIDEVQYAKKPSNFLKYLFDTYNPNLKIIATGSSAFYLDKKFKDSLAGRKRIFILKTLNFEEFLIFKEQPELVNELHQIRKRKEYLSLRYNELMHLFDEYLNYGGYPDIVLTSDKNEKISKLEELKNSFLKRDFIESGAENETGFYQLLISLSAQTGNLVNKNELSKTLGIDFKTVNNYLYILQKCFHIELITPFYKNLRKELIKMPKVYFNDLGLRNVLLKRFHNIAEREDRGQILENYFLIRLKELYLYEKIQFWRTLQGNEVDFVVSETYGKGKAYEIKFNASTLKLSKYKIFQNTYPEYPLQFIEYFYSDSKSALPVIKV